MSKEEAQKKSFKRVKEDVGKVLSHPLLRPTLEEALRFPLLEQKEQEAMFGFLVEENAQRCLFGVPEDEITGEYMCKFLIELVDHVAHARPALGRAVDLYGRENKDLMPPCLREFIEDPGEPPKRRGGPRPEAQDWTALRDQIIAMAIGYADHMQRDRA